jgi:hypothetical protein
MKSIATLLLLLILGATACAPRVNCPAYTVEKPLVNKEVSI